MGVVAMVIAAVLGGYTAFLSLVHGCEFLLLLHSEHCFTMKTSGELSFQLDFILGVGLGWFGNH